MIATLNASLTDTDQLVLTSRTREYGAAVAGARDVLTAAAVIEPEPLSPTQAADYLAACLPPHPDPSWEQVLDRLRGGAAGALATVLATPLGLWLLRTVYTTPGADPAALLRFTAAPAAVRAYLFDQLIPAVLATRPPSGDHADPFRPRRLWPARQMRTWLIYLAEYLHRTGTRDFLWWHLARQTLNARHVRLGSGLIAGLAAGLSCGLALGSQGVQTIGPIVGSAVGVAIGLAVGLVFGLVAGLVVNGWLSNEPAYANLRLKHRTKLLARKLARGLLLGLVVGVVVGLAWGVALGLVILLAYLFGAQLPAASAEAFQAGLLPAVLQGLGEILLLGLVFGLFGLLFGLLAAPQGAWAGGLLFGLLGVLVGVRVFGRGSLSGGAWFSYALASGWLAGARRLPLRLMDFLDDAHRLGLLRMTGPAYQFRHAEFHDHLLEAAGSSTG